MRCLAMVDIQKEHDLRPPKQFQHFNNNKEKEKKQKQKKESFKRRLVFFCFKCFEKER
jgi:hypothetical protein